MSSARHASAVVLVLAGCGGVDETSDAQTAGATVSVTVTGNGTVTSAPDGIACGAACSAEFSLGTSVTLTATAAAGHRFSGWTGACTGTGACTLDVRAETTVTATFTSEPRLAITIVGPGSVTSAPAGIDCGTTCEAQLPSGSGVILNAANGANAQFMGWSGAGCTGNGSCVLNLTADTTVTATFFRQFLVNQHNAGQRHLYQLGGTPTAFHTATANDADCNAPQGSPLLWFVDHNADQLGKTTLGSPTNTTQTVPYAFPKHVTVFANSVYVMSRNDGVIHRYNLAGTEIGTVTPPAGFPIGQGLATNGTDLYASYWNPTGATSGFQRYDALLIPQGTMIPNPTGLMGTENNVFDLVHVTGTTFAGLVTTGEGGTGTASTTVIEFEMGGAAGTRHTLPFTSDGIGQANCP